ncbi:hypothetical protein [Methylocella sp. CPCC 101449]|uniref:hypothetical protein n=1 Tax=Methylocella sp. CPCC 101449 TaxID=2987531 RepID=UPI00289062F1|nr:hypothetical protein [Methylocella sp. CPCC 101449]MDT2024553.1 hypothetical protein [Methylocella sp. CPCC 101449]
MANPIHPNRASFAEHKQLTYFVVPEAGTSEEDILDPVYWSHMARQLSQFSEIRVFFEDRPLRVDLMVTSSGPAFANVIVLHRYDLSGAKADGDYSKYEAKYRGPHSKWTVMRKADGKVMKEGLTEEAARAEAKDFEKIQAAAA